MEHCTYCQGELYPGQPFCPHCGQRRTESAATTSVLPQEKPDGSPTPSTWSWNDQAGDTEPEPPGERWPSTKRIPLWKLEKPPETSRPLPLDRRLTLGIVALVALVSIIGLAVLVLISHPTPVITVTSPYHVNGLPAGAATTSLHVEGQNFADDSAIQFLLDGHALSERSQISSDQQGSINIQLEIAPDWPLGTHSLTASDAAHNVTPKGVSVVIVNQGEANTPGPNGAPPDDASFSITATVQNEGAFNHQGYSFQLNLLVHGQPDPKGGSICASRDNGLSQTFTGRIYNTATGASNGLTYQESITFRCSGQYKHGQVNYTEQATSDHLILSNGVSCVGQTPYVFRSLQGMFSDPTHIGGVWSSDPIVYQCTSGFSLLGPSAQTGIWTGQKS